jgi:hypothetical protein
METLIMCLLAKNYQSVAQFCKVIAKTKKGAIFMPHSVDTWRRVLTNYYHMTIHVDCYREQCIYTTVISFD